ncbi:MAG: molybdopterin-dependent oxidoreductase [Chloroflexi bacterium]|nr:molybdopterin-dependent oxidoreductase [Chloroflexota bacterium]
MRRREFLKLIGVGAASSVLIGEGSAEAEGDVPLILPRLKDPEGFVPGVANWYSSICQQCPAGCGIIVRNREGRAKKIEGNPAYPLNAGRLCALGQSGLQALYNPDRLKAPLRRSGERGSGSFQEISWDEAIDTLTNKLKDLQSKRRGDGLVFFTGPLRGHQGLIADLFTQSQGGRHVSFDSNGMLEGRDALRAATRLVYGREDLPVYDIGNANFLLSFGAPFLETWLSPVQYGVAFGQMRQGRSERPRFIHVETRHSLTAANADEWISIIPGTEAALALGLAKVITDEGNQAAGVIIGRDSRSVLDKFSPGEASRLTGVPTQTITRLGKEFAAKRGLALAGGPAAANSNGLAALVAANALNVLVGNVGQKGGVLCTPTVPLAELASLNPRDTFRDTVALVDRMRSGKPSSVEVLMLLDTNPVYALPAGVGFSQALEKVPFVVSFSSFMDETTNLADLILPSHTYLEQWGDDVPEPGAGLPTLGLQQPVVEPIYNTRSAMDVLLTVAAQLGGASAKALPWGNSMDLLRETAKGLQQAGASEADFERFWIHLLAQGGWWDELAKPEGGKATSFPSLSFEEPRFEGDPKEYPFYLHLYPSIALRDGRGANQPWLQELPDPTTMMTWGSWVELNPTTARRLSLEEGDIVKVESTQGAIEAPVYVYPAIPEDLVSLPVGQGHTSYGRYAQNRGVNPLKILAPSVQPQTGGLAWGTTRVKITKTGQSVRLPKLEGMTREVPDAPIVQTEVLR